VKAAPAAAGPGFARRRRRGWRETPTRARPGSVARLAGATALISTLLAAGCGTDPNSIAGQARSGDQKGYVSGDGSVEQIPSERRGAPVDLSGTTLDGKPWTLAAVPTQDLVVLNVWGSWCGPCVAEAPELEKAWSQLQAKAVPVQFVGLDFKEGPEAGLAFQRTYKVTYPSLTFDGGRAVQGLQGKAPTVPTTLVLDRSRRIAGRILGQTDATTLTGLVSDVLAQEPPATAPGAGG